MTRLTRTLEALTSAPEEKQYKVELRQTKRVNSVLLHNYVLITFKRELYDKIKEQSNEEAACKYNRFIQAPHHFNKHTYDVRYDIIRNGLFIENLLAYVLTDIHKDNFQFAQNKYDCDSYDLYDFSISMMHKKYDFDVCGGAVEQSNYIVWRKLRKSKLDNYFILAKLHDYSAQLEVFLVCKTRSKIAKALANYAAKYERVMTSYNYAKIIIFNYKDELVESNKFMYMLFNV